MAPRATFARIATGTDVAERWGVIIDTQPNTPSSEPIAAPDPFAALIERWFVTYNPVYLASAALVLGGLWLVGRDFLERRVLGGLGVSIIAELYALALIGGAAILHRAGQRRPAVMLGLLAALYQCDLTLTVEMCAYLGRLGWLGSVGWIVLFVAKLGMLGAALGLRLSRSALLVPSLGAAAIGLGPQLLPHLLRDARGAVVGIAVLAIGAAGATTARSIACDTGFDVRGRRAIRGLWWLGGAAGLAHVAYWGGQGVPLVPTVIALALLATRALQREHHVWAVVLGLLALTAWAAPSAHLGVTALMAAGVLALRALRSPVPATDAPRVVTPPYRGATEAVEASTITELAAPIATFVAAPFDERARLLLGAAACAHLGLTVTLSPARWPGVAWPEHQLLLDVALAAVCALAAWRWRRWRALTTLVPASAHLAACHGWLAWPTTALGWGGSAIGLGFVSLAAAIGVSLWSQRRMSHDRSSTARTTADYAAACAASPPSPS